MRGIFPVLLAIGVGVFVLILIWRLLTKGTKVRLAALGKGDIERTAAELIEKHGDQADAAVARHAQDCLAIGDFDGEAVWQRVAKAVRKQQSPKRRAGKKPRAE